MKCIIRGCNFSIPNIFTTAANQEPPFEAQSDIHFCITFKTEFKRYFKIDQVDLTSFVFYGIRYPDQRSGIGSAAHKEIAIDIMCAKTQPDGKTEIAFSERNVVSPKNIHTLIYDPGFYTGWHFHHNIVKYPETDTDPLFGRFIHNL